MDCRPPPGILPANMFSNTKNADWLPLEMATLSALRRQPKRFFRNEAISVRNS